MFLFKKADNVINFIVGILKIYDQDKFHAQVA